MEIMYLLESSSFICILTLDLVLFERNLTSRADYVDSAWENLLVETFD
jgi:hypothetical protein